MQLAVETVYLEVTLQLVSKTSSSLSSSQAKALEDLVFDWVLHAEKFVDSRFLDLMKARAKVTWGGGIWCILTAGGHYPVSAY